MPSPGVHPIEEPRPTTSYAERAVWKALDRGLPPGWHAWHSLRIRDERAFEGEGDFVLAHPARGLLVVEVKGGRIEQRDGLWYQNGVRLDPPPLDQARRFVRKLLGRLAKTGCQPPAFGCAVWFPETVVDRQPTQDDLNGVVLGSNDLAWAREALPPVVERALPAPVAGAGHWTDALHRLWGETWVPGLSLGGRVQQDAERRVALDAEQLRALEMVLDNERVLVQGGAGSGKTLVAAEAARRFAAGGKRVLLLCFTAPLAHWLAGRLVGTGVEVDTVSRFAKRVVDASGTPAVADDPTSSVFWRAVYLRAAELVDRGWEAVVVDEAQDLETDAWLLVSELATGKRLWAFHDPGQRFWPERKPPPELFTTTCRLQEQQRCPPGIQALAQRVLGLEHDPAAIAAAKADGILSCVVAPSRSSLPDRVGAEVDRLRSRGLASSQIGIVSLRGQSARDAVHHLSAVGTHAFVSAADPDMESRLVADSFLRWKGLERPAIIVTDVQPDTSNLAVRLHIALTRATSVARLVVTADGASVLPPEAR